MTEQSEPPLEMVFSFYESIQRKGPGSEASTLKAFSLLNDLPATPRIVEFGCGAGVATLPLARSSRGHLTAVDIHQPFLDELQATAAHEGLADRITTVQADMGNPPFPNNTFDLIWSESAIYNLGFEQGLRLWKPLLKPGGHIAVSEVVWLTSEPPRKAKEFWDADYPSMTTVNENQNRMKAAGFDLLGHFVIPTEDWQNYYGPLQDHVTAFRTKHSANATAQAFADSLQQEIDLWKEYGDSYGYCFFIGKAV
ncbi:Demethylrebeccamycin-D-glucose O-methyltransferase [Gimesia alba]|uniref:Demethylrebeccamycin-D-glucose O-methyltransferase n=1 Tax=Gimesia alba TaxID=2527973 RepID=A0A517RFV8_9PLAN|nr:class I SAM-dependent methyltransferase [Gimesia alba]QDT42759.1 Demethylrebeccamycin-D-glucose O-methyltransferase [Gimesia alba]